MDENGIERVFPDEPVHQRPAISAMPDPARHQAIKRHLYRIGVLAGRMVVALACVRMAMLVAPPWEPLFNGYLLVVLAVWLSYEWTRLGAPRIRPTLVESIQNESFMATGSTWRTTLRDLRDPVLLGAMVAAGWAVWALVG